MMSQHISLSTDATAPVLNPRKRRVTSLPFLFSFLLFLPHCGYSAIRCIDTALEEGLLQLRCIYQGCTTQGALQVMLPLLHEHDVRRLTLETGIVAKNKKPFQLTIGSSFRHAFSAEGFWGVNGVLDASDKENGTQLSVGIEGYLSSFFTSLSYYLPLGTIQEAVVQTDHKKQLAKSIEARVFYTFPSVKSIRTGLVVEQLLGDAIELPGSEEKQKNPRRGSLQIEYQPMPLVNFHLGYQFQTGSSRRHQVVTGIGLTFRFNQPLSEQIKRSIQKKVLLTGDGAYEMISRRHDRAIDHGTMPKAATPVVVLATTQGVGKAPVPEKLVTVPEPSGGTNGGGSAPQDKGQITSSNGKPLENRPAANQSQREKQVEVYEQEAVDPDALRRANSLLLRAAEGYSTDPNVISALLNENNTDAAYAEKPVERVTTEFGEMSSSASVQCNRKWKEDEPIRRREEEEIANEDKRLGNTRLI